MAKSILYPVHLGGDGQRYSDDNDPNTGMGLGGHRLRFIPACGGTIDMANTAIRAAQVATSASLQSSTYIATSTTNITPAAGDLTLTTQAGKGFFEGQWVVATSGAGKWFNGQVVSYAGTQLVVRVTAGSFAGAAGAGWVIAPGNGTINSTIVNVPSAPAAADIVGQIQSNQIESLSVTKLTGLIQDYQIETVDATQITGYIQASQLDPSIPIGGGGGGTPAPGSITMDMLASGIRPLRNVSTLPTSPYTGYTQGDQVFDLSTGYPYEFTGSGWTNTRETGRLIGQVTGSQISAGALDMTKFAATIRPPRTVASRPILPDVNYPIGDEIYSQADGKRYTNIANSWSSSVAAVDVSGQLVGSQIAASAITLDKFDTSLRPVRSVAALPAIDGTVYRNGDCVTLQSDGLLYRAAGGSWTAATPASTITGQLAAAQIAALEASKITGQLSNAQLAAIDAAKVTGQLVASQLAIEIGGGNFVTNSSFEVDSNADGLADGWTAYSFGTTGAVTRQLGTSGAKHGTWAQQVIATGLSTGVGDHAGVYQVVAVPNAGGKNFVASVWMAASNGCTGRIYIEFLNASDAPIDANSVQQGLVAGASPVRLRLAFTAPAGTAKMRLYLWAASRQTAAGSVTVQFDGAQIEAGDVMTAYAPRPDELLAGTVTTTVIADDAITAAKIVAGAVVAGKVAANAISANELQAGSVTTAKLVAGAVTANELAANSVIAGKIAANSISAAELQAGSVTTAKLVAGAVTANELAANSVIAGKIAANAVTANELAANSVIAGKIAANAISANELQANAVVAGKIAANAISANELQANAVTAGKIAASAVGADQIAASAIRARHLLVTNSGMYLNVDPDFTDSAAWQVANTETVQPTFGVVLTSAGSFNAVAPTYVAANNAAGTGPASVWLLSNQTLPIDPGSTYNMEAMFASDPGNSRTAYLAINFLDSLGNLITSTGWGGEWSGYPWSGAVIADGKFYRYSGAFGAGTAKAIPSNATQCRIGIILNYGGGGNNLRMYAQGVKLYKQVASTEIKDGAIITDKIAANAVTAVKVNTADLTANSAFINNLFANTFTARKITATEIVTNGMIIRDTAGNELFSASTALPTDAASVLGFNPQFSDWTGAYPAGWEAWGGATPAKETSNLRTGPYAVYWTVNTGNVGMVRRNVSWASSPLPAGTFLQGSFDINIIANNGGIGRPGYLITLFTNAALTTGRDTFIPVTDKTVGGWRREAFTARVQPGERIYGMTVYQMASWEGFDGGWALGSVCIFDNLTFEWRDASTDNTQQQWTDVQARPADEDIRNNLIDLSWWKRDAAPPWNLNGEFNRLAVCSPAASGVDLPGIPGPRGGTDVVWYCQEVTGNGDAGGGWNSPALTLDPTKTYRFAIPMRRLSGNGTMWWGIDNIAALNTNTSTPNPYFVPSYSAPATDRWYLLVGYLYPAGSTGNNSDSCGVWDCKTGEKVSNGNAYNFIAGAGSVYHRAYHYYASQINSSQAIGRPMVNVIDGTEPSLKEYFEPPTLGVSVRGQIDATTRPTVVNNAAFTAVGMTLNSTGLTVHQAGVPSNVYFQANASSPPWVVSMENVSTGSGVALVGQLDSSNRQPIKSLSAGSGIVLDGSGNSVVISSLASETANLARHADYTVTGTMAALDGMTFAVEANTTYQIEGCIYMLTGATNNGVQVGLLAPNGAVCAAMFFTPGSDGYYRNSYSSWTGDGTNYQALGGYSTSASGTVVLGYHFSVNVTTTNAGVLTIGARSWGGGGNITAKKGSFARLSRLKYTQATAITLAAAPWGMSGSYASDHSTSASSISGNIALYVNSDGTIKVHTNGTVYTYYWKTGASTVQGAGQNFEVYMAPGTMSSSGQLTNTGSSTSCPTWTSLSTNQQAAIWASSNANYSSISCSVSIGIRPIGGSAQTFGVYLNVYLNTRDNL